MKCIDAHKEIVILIDNPKSAPTTEAKITITIFIKLELNALFTDEYCAFFKRASVKQH